MSDINLANDDIRATEVRVVTDDGEQLGIMSRSEAMIKAKEAGLDLVLITDKADIPVCRITDFSKFKYAAIKRKKDAAKASREAKIDNKELWMRPGTDIHDINVKLKHAIGFIEKGHRVKVGIKFRGREMQYKQQGREVLDQFLAGLGNVKVEQAIKDNDRTMTFVVIGEKEKG